MPRYITEQKNDAKLAAAMDNFLAQAIQHRNNLGLSTEDIDEITEKFSAFKADFESLVSQKQLLKATTTSKNSSKRAAKQVIAKFAQEWRADLSIPDSILDELSLPNHATSRTRSAPSQPLDLQLTSSTTGENTLSWNRNGNTPGTIYQVESAPSASGPWTPFEVLTATRFRFEWPIGQEVWLRVSAKRNRQTSVPSRSIALWAGGQSESKLAA